MKFEWDNDIITVALEGRIDSANSGDVENEIIAYIGDKKPASVILNAAELE